MGLFSKKPSQKTQNDIAQHIFWVQTAYKTMFDGCGIEVFVNCKQRVFTSLNALIAYEKKYSSYFKNPKPTANNAKIIKELPSVEKKFVDYTIINLERKLLNYSTDRGKRNNFNKEVNIFKYYAGDFLPQTVEYFDKQIHERFPEYLQ